MERRIVNRKMSFQTYDAQYYVIVESITGTAISDVEAVISPAGTPSGVTFPYGFFNFTINGVGIGGGTTVMVYLPDGAAPTTFYKYGPEPTDPNDHWYEFRYDGETGAEIKGSIITLHFVDGKRGDDDLDDTNGVIVDLGGLGLFNADSGGGSDEGGGGAGCFVSTAAFSSLKPYR
jgi:hypothetical protein